MGWAKIGPFKNDSPLAIHTNAMKAFKSPLSASKQFPGGDFKSSKIMSIIQHVEFANHDLFDSLPASFGRQFASFKKFF